MSGQEQTRGQKIFAEVKAILADEEKKKASCPLPHRFTIPVDRHTRKPIEKRIFCKWGCERCGAIVDFQEKHWYELGLQHAKSIS